MPKGKVLTFDEVIERRVKREAFFSQEQKKDPNFSPKGYDFDPKDWIDMLQQEMPYKFKKKRAVNDRLVELSVTIKNYVNKEYSFEKEDVRKAAREKYEDYISRKPEDADKDHPSLTADLIALHQSLLLEGDIDFDIDKRVEAQEYIRFFAASMGIEAPELHITDTHRIVAEAHDQVHFGIPSPMIEAKTPGHGTTMDTYTALEYLDEETALIERAREKVNRTEEEQELVDSNPLPKPGEGGLYHSARYLRQMLENLPEEVRNAVNSDHHALDAVDTSLDLFLKRLNGNVYHLNVENDKRANQWRAQIKKMLDPNTGEAYIGSEFKKVWNALQPHMDKIPEQDRAQLQELFRITAAGLDIDIPEMKIEQKHRDAAFRGTNKEVVALKAVDSLYNSKDRINEAREYDAPFEKARRERRAKEKQEEERRRTIRSQREQAENGKRVWNDEKRKAVTLTRSAPRDARPAEWKPRTWDEVFQRNQKHEASLKAKGLTRSEYAADQDPRGWLKLILKAIPNNMFAKADENDPEVERVKRYIGYLKDIDKDFDDYADKKTDAEYKQSIADVNSDWFATPAEKADKDHGSLAHQLIQIQHYVLTSPDLDHLEREMITNRIRYFAASLGIDTPELGITDAHRTAVMGAEAKHLGILTDEMEAWLPGPGRPMTGAQLAYFMNPDLAVLEEARERGEQGKRLNEFEKDLIEKNPVPKPGEGGLYHHLRHLRNMLGGLPQEVRAALESANALGLAKTLGGVMGLMNNRLFAPDSGARNAAKEALRTMDPNAGENYIGNQFKKTWEALSPLMEKLPEQDRAQLRELFRLSAAGLSLDVPGLGVEQKHLDAARKELEQSNLVGVAADRECRQVAKLCENETLEFNDKFDKEREAKRQARKDAEKAATEEKYRKLREWQEKQQEIGRQQREKEAKEDEEWERKEKERLRQIHEQESQEREQQEKLQKAEERVKGHQATLDAACERYRKQENPSLPNPTPIDRNDTDALRAWAAKNKYLLIDMRNTFSRIHDKLFVNKSAEQVMAGGGSALMLQMRNMAEAFDHFTNDPAHSVKVLAEGFHWLQHPGVATEQSKLPFLLNGTSTGLADKMWKLNRELGLGIEDPDKTLVRENYDKAFTEELRIRVASEDMNYEREQESRRSRTRELDWKRLAKNLADELDLLPELFEDIKNKPEGLIEDSRALQTRLRDAKTPEEFEKSMQDLSLFFDREVDGRSVFEHTAASNPGKQFFARLGRAQGCADGIREKQRIAEAGQEYQKRKTAAYDAYQADGHEQLAADLRKDFGKFVTDTLLRMEAPFSMRDQGKKLYEALADAKTNAQFVNCVSDIESFLKGNELANRSLLDHAVIHGPQTLTVSLGSAAGHAGRYFDKQKEMEKLKAAAEALNAEKIKSAKNLPDPETAADLIGEIGTIRDSVLFAIKDCPKGVRDEADKLQDLLGKVKTEEDFTKGMKSLHAFLNTKVGEYTVLEHAQLSGKMGEDFQPRLGQALALEQEIQNREIIKTVFAEEKHHYEDARKAYQEEGGRDWKKLATALDKDLDTLADRTLPSAHAPKELAEKSRELQKALRGAKTEEAFEACAKGLRDFLESEAFNGHTVQEHAAVQGQRSLVTNLELTRGYLSGIRWKRDMFAKEEQKWREMYSVKKPLFAAGLANEKGEQLAPAYAAPKRGGAKSWDGYLYQHCEERAADKDPIDCLAKCIVAKKMKEAGAKFSVKTARQYSEILKNDPVFLTLLNLDVKFLHMGLKDAGTLDDMVKKIENPFKQLGEVKTATETLKAVGDKLPQSPAHAKEWNELCRAIENQEKLRPTEQMLRVLNAAAAYQQAAVGKKGLPPAERQCFQASCDVLSALAIASPLAKVKIQNQLNDVQAALDAAARKQKGPAAQPLKVQIKTHEQLAQQYPAPEKPAAAPVRENGEKKVEAPAANH